LRYITAESNPSLYASIQNNLGNVYKNMPGLERQQNLRLAITCYREALRFFTPEESPGMNQVLQQNLEECIRLSGS
jgi:hypothetical protein